MAGVMGERGSAEQQEDQDNPHHDRLPFLSKGLRLLRGLGAIFQIDVHRIKART
jgi:hypothetical protein